MYLVNETNNFCGFVMNSNNESKELRFIDFSVVQSRFVRMKFVTQKHHDIKQANSVPSCNQ